MNKSKSGSSNPDKRGKKPIADSSEKLAQIQNILADTPEEEKLDILQYAAMSETRHSGPLPDPETLAKYNKIIDNGAERIMTMAEKQSKHREALEKSTISRQLNQSSVGQFFGFMIAIIALAISWDLARNDHEVVAGIIGGATVVGLVSVFVIGKKRQRESEDDDI